MAAKDVVLIATLITALAIAFFVVHSVINTVVDDMIVNPVINSSEESVSALSAVKPVTNRFDYVIFGTFMALLLSLIVTAWFVGGHPVFMFVYFIVIVIAVILATLLSNVWYTVINKSVFLGTIGYFPITDHLIQNLPFYTAIAGFIGLVVMFAKPYMSE